MATEPPDGAMKVHRADCGITEQGGICTCFGQSVRVNMKAQRTPMLLVEVPMTWLEFAGIVSFLSAELEQMKRRGQVPNNARIAFDALEKQIARAFEFARQVGARWHREDDERRKRELKQAESKQSKQ